MVFSPVSFDGRQPSSVWCNPSAAFAGWRRKQCLDTVIASHANSLRSVGAVGVVTPLVPKSPKTMRPSGDQDAGKWLPVVSRSTSPVPSAPRNTIPGPPSCPAEW